MHFHFSVCSFISSTFICLSMFAAFHDKIDKNKEGKISMDHSSGLSPLVCLPLEYIWREAEFHDGDHVVGLGIRWKI